jgi:DNA-binding protein HU-beta
MPMSKSEIAKTLAEKAGITKKQSDQFLEELANLAYKEAKNSFTLPGLGKLVLVNRAARMGRNPKTGEAIQIPAKTVLKFRIAKAAKEAIGGASGSTPVKKDDLVIIEGIGPKIAQALGKAGIKTFKQLSETQVDKIHRILADSSFSADPATWPEQARLAAAGRMDELKRLQDKLTAGRAG